MAPKTSQPRKKSATCLSSSHDGEQFINEEGQRRFQTCVSNRKIILERIVALCDFSLTHFFIWLEHRCLVSLCTLDGEVIEDWVREFYCNMHDADENSFAT